jgi:glycosyltransferase involved in cell wall biosynthesis
MVIVNDGSKDGTAELIKNYSRQYQDDSLSVRGVSLLQNQGKGAAVKYVGSKCHFISI